MPQSEMREEVEKLLKQLRSKELGLTIEQLAIQSDVPINVIKKLSNKSRTVDRTLFESIEKLYFYSKEHTKNDKEQ